MLFEQFEDPGLSQYSYAVGCHATREMAVVDPRRDIDIYLDFAERQKVHIAYVLETHIHADFASGALELAEAAGAELCVSGYDKGEKYEVRFPHTDIYDEDALELGQIRIEAVHTPGHTPEHLAFLVYDHTRSSEIPMLMLSGDFLFVGSLGRPDLLGEEAKLELARQMYDSVRDKLADLPDGLEVYPGHGAGSMCGSGMSSRPFTTMGFERVTNPYLRAAGREQLVEQLLASVPPFPDYYRKMKNLNSQGPPTLSGIPGQRPLNPVQFKSQIEAGAVAIDLRDQVAFGRGHVPGSFGIGAGDSLSTWAAWVVPYGRPILLVPGSNEQVEPAVRSLVRVGLDGVEGFLQGGVRAWIDAGEEVSTTPQLSPQELSRRLIEEEEIQILDVRTHAEWTEGHIEGAIHIMGGKLPDQLEQIPRGRPLAVVCGSGYRSTVAASVLERAGFEEVCNITGGMTAWTQKGLPTVQEESEEDQPEVENSEGVELGA